MKEKMFEYIVHGRLHGVKPVTKEEYMKNCRDQYKEKRIDPAVPDPDRYLPLSWLRSQQNRFFDNDEMFHVFHTAWNIWLSLPYCERDAIMSSEQSTSANETTNETTDPNKYVSNDEVLQWLNWNAEGYKKAGRWFESDLCSKLAEEWNYKPDYSDLEKEYKNATFYLKKKDTEVNLGESTKINLGDNIDETKLVINGTSFLDKYIPMDWLVSRLNGAIQRGDKDAERIYDHVFCQWNSDKELYSREKSVGTITICVQNTDTPTQP